MPLRRLLLACLISLAWPGAAAADFTVPFPACGLEVHIGSDCCRANATAKLRLTIQADMCARVSTLAGDLSVLDLPIADAGTSIVVGVQSVDTQGNCPAVVVPFDLEVRLPETLPLVGMPSEIPLALYVSRSRGEGRPVLQHCGEITCRRRSGALPACSSSTTAASSPRCSGRYPRGRAVPGPWCPIQ